MNHKIAIIGCGNLGKSIAKGLLADPSFSPSDLTVTKRNTSGLTYLEESGVHVTSDNNIAVSNAEIVIIAVKPYNVEEIVAEISDQIDPKQHIIVSVATGVTIENIRNIIGKDVDVVRAMPNTATDVGESVTAIAQVHAKQEKLQNVIEVFEKIGKTIEINESLMEAATILGACGIAYVMRFIRAMVQGGIEIGFDAKTASAIVNQTVKGAAELLIERKEHPEFEIDKVTTPRGCTITGLNEMEHHGFSSSLIRGIVTSYNKIEKG